MSEAEDRQALAQLVAAYARGCDRRRPEEVAALYTEGGGFAIVDTGAEPLEISGYDRMVSGFSRLSRYEHTFHLLGQQTVDLDGDRATGECYCLAHHVEVADDGSRSVMTMHIRYQDRYARTPGGWKFEHRTLMVDWRETRPLVAPE
jgi:hypothetical protein